MKINISMNQQRHSGPWGFLTRTIILTLATMIAIKLLPGVRIVDGSIAAAILTALVISLLDNFLRPILIFVTLPVTLLSMGLFIFIINAIIIELTAAIVTPFEVDSFGYALLFSLIITVLNYLLELPSRWLNKGVYRERGTSDNTPWHGDDDDEFTDYEEVE